MNKTHKINLVIFITFCLVIISFAYFGGADFLSKQEKPWHMQTGLHEDSLSSDYTTTYPIFDRHPAIRQIEPKDVPTVLILVDAWGLPLNESKLKKEFDLFSSLPHSFAIHKRLGNRTKHAEHVEFRIDSYDAVFIFGGDSLEYGRKEYIPTLGYGEQLYYQNYSDSMMIEVLDSLLSGQLFSTIAWTTQDSRLGDEKKLIYTLKNIAELAQKWPTIRFIVQGTHRPILGTPEKKREYYSHWVPVVVINP